MSSILYKFNYVNILIPYQTLNLTSPCSKGGNVSWILCLCVCGGGGKVNNSYIKKKLELTVLKHRYTVKHSLLTYFRLLFNWMEIFQNEI